VSAPGRRRASGQEAGAEEAEKAAQSLEEPIEPQLPEDRAKQFDFVGFSRMRLEWSQDEKTMMTRIKAAVDGAILNHFGDAYSVMNDLYDVVREPITDAQGTVQTDQWGMVIWARTPTGGFVEDWSRLGYAQRETFLYRITTAIFEWEQRAADLWGEAMFAKAIWQEHFAVEYDKPMSGTIEDRTAVGNMKTSEDKYFAIFLSLLSRRADAVVRAMNLLSQRLKDTMGS
jgi:hypothetical protein